MISFVKGDIFESGADVFVNPVNCVGVMGKGLALEFKRRYPKMYVDYRKACTAGFDRLGIGRLHVWGDADVTIINLPTKQHWRDPSKISYVVAGLVALKEQLQFRRQRRVAIPALGCGEGRLKWPDVRDSISEILRECPSNILVYEPQ